MEPNPGVLFFYFQWADEMHSRWESHGQSDHLAAAYWRTWLGALYVVAEGWKRLRERDPSLVDDRVVQALFDQRTGGKRRPRDKPERDETYLDLLYDVRNAVFHFSWRHWPAPMERFHNAFRAFFDRRAS